MQTLEQLNGRAPTGHRWSVDGHATTLKPADPQWLDTGQMAEHFCVSRHQVANFSRSMKDNGVRTRTRSMIAATAVGAGRDWYLDDILKIRHIMHILHIRPSPAIKIFGALKRGEI